MSRPWIATFAGVFFFVAYLIAAATLGSALARAHWALQFIYYAIAGIVWFPVVRWLMLWAAHKR